MLINELIKVLELSWNKNTCDPSLQEDWNENNKALGQCVVTALIVNDFLGGKIMKCMVESESHYYNLVNGNVIDLTASKFDIVPDYTQTEERTREYLLSNKDTMKRYKLLLNKVKDNFVKYGRKRYTLLDVNGQYFSSVPGTCGGNKKLKVYGRLDCPSALRYIEEGYYVDNRVFFESIEIANKLGYRPCAKCMRKEYEIWKLKNKKK